MIFEKKEPPSTKKGETYVFTAKIARK